jgi:hypothetical protein
MLSLMLDSLSCSFYIQINENEKNSEIIRLSLEEVLYARIYIIVTRWLFLLI